MCGRYTLTTSGEALAEAFDLDEPAELRARYNIAPTTAVPCVRVDEGRRHLVHLRWGLIPVWAKDVSIGARMINARVETLFEKPAFKSLLEKRRCLVVSDGFYEWVGEGKARRPVLLRFEDGHPFAYAGLWTRWKPKGDAGEAIESCTIITTPPNALAARVHDRMPLIFDPRVDRQSIEQWLDVSQKPDLAELRAPRELPGFHFYPVDKRVGNVRNDDEQCAAPIGAPDTLPAAVS